MRNSKTFQYSVIIGAMLLAASIAPAEASNSGSGGGGGKSSNSGGKSGYGSNSGYSPSPSPSPSPLSGKPDLEKGYHHDSRTVLHLLNELSGKRFRETDANLAFISQRLREPGVDLAGVRLMLERQVKRWSGTPQAEYLRPETLFNKTKFDGYYAARGELIVTDLTIPQRPSTAGMSKEEILKAAL